MIAEIQIYSDVIKVIKLFIIKCTDTRMLGKIQDSVELEGG